MITINCGGCGKKNCQIKKDFRLLSKKYEQKGTWGLFKLQCPYKTPAFKDGDKVKFTVAFGYYEIKTKWECTFDCDYCKDRRCDDDGFITFTNHRYKGNVEFDGTVIGNSNYKKFAIKVDMEQFLSKKHLFNEHDLKTLNSINDSIDYPNYGKLCNINNLFNIKIKESEDRGKYMFFMSKRKFIKKK